MTAAAYLDRDAPIAERVEDLIGRMTLEEKAGQMFHTMALVGPGATDAIDAFNVPSPPDMILDRHITHCNLVGVGTALELAAWTNELQELSAQTRLRIPITVSSDPRHGFTRNVGTGEATAAFSTWPEPLGLAAIGDPDLVERFADICRQECIAVGIRVALHPQLDVASEPRWARILGTFGEDPDAVARLGVAYLRGLQGTQFGTESVTAIVKHFPGGGPLRDGEDSHFETGREQVYPGGRFEDHLRPFRDAVASGARQVMPSYGMPLGLKFEEVACGFNRDLLTMLLRGELGFDGVICTDWGLLTDSVLLGQAMPARAWGVEHLTPLGRARKALDAGVDQFGGEHSTELVVRLVRDGTIVERRLDQSLRRILRDKFALGLFEQRYSDVERAGAVAGRADFRAAGRAAQSRSVTVLTNQHR